jgi:hypothetical protein
MTTMTMQVRTVVAALAAVAVVGCSGNAGGSGGTAQNAAGAATTANAGAAPGSFDVCTLLPAATVASITGQAPTESTAKGIGDRHACEYGGTITASVVVVRPGGAADFASTAGSGDTPVSGLGDRAFYNPSVGVVALFGDTEVQAHLEQPGSLTPDQVSAMEQAMVKALQPKL